MEVDIRYPIGFMFTLLGLLLTVFGLATTGDAALYVRSLGIDVNLWSGILMLVFGLFMLLFAFRARKHSKEFKS